MLIGGLQKCSLVDYPEKVSAVVFTQGCNFRCPYCHNPALVHPSEYTIPIPEDEVLFFLQKRRFLLDGVVISGGEALLQEDLIGFLKHIKALGYPVKLDTNGSRPDELNKAIREKCIDYVAMDIKAPFYKYSIVAGVKVDIDAIQESITAIIRSGVNYQFRTTNTKNFLDEKDIELIREYTGRTESYVVQEMNPYAKFKRIE